MNDLLSKQDEIDAMTSEIWHFPNECYRNFNAYEFAKALAELGLRSVPFAEPIIRCKDCVHYNAGFECLIEGYGIETNPEHFCGYAERRVEHETD